MSIWYILWSFGNLYASQLFGIFCQEKSGSPGEKAAGRIEPPKTGKQEKKNRWHKNGCSM
jgi:hypothetical protein